MCVLVYCVYVCISRVFMCVYSGAECVCLCILKILGLLCGQGS